jgi:WD40 repeat protein
VFDRLTCSCWLRVTIMIVLVGSAAACASAPEPTHTPMPTSTPAPDFGQLIPTAGPLCEAAFSTEPSIRTISKPSSSLFYLLNRKYEGDAWVVHGFEADKGWPPTARSPSQVEALVCIRESRNREATYTDSSAGYRRSWRVNVVGYPDGTVFASELFLGEPPPANKHLQGDAYGLLSLERARNWLQLVLRMPTLQLDRLVSDMVFSPDGTILATATGEAGEGGLPGKSKGWVTLWDMETGQELRTVAHQGFVDDMAFSPDGKTLIAAGFRGITLWDVTTGQELPNPCCARFPTYGIERAAISHNGTLFAAQGYRPREVLWWQIADGSLLGSLNLKSSSTQACLALSPDGTALAYGYIGGPLTLARSPVTVLDTTTGQELHRLSGNEDFCSALAFSPDGGRLIVTDRAGKARLWDMETGQVLGSVEATPEWRWRAVAFAPDSKTLALSEACIDAARVTLYHWDGATLNESAKIDVTGFPDALAFSPGGETLAISTSLKRLVILWDVQSPRPEAAGEEPTPERPGTAATLKPAATRAAAKPAPTKAPIAERVKLVAFSPDRCSRMLLKSRLCMKERRTRS